MASHKTILPGSETRKPPGGRWENVLWLLSATAVGLLLRVYRLNEQSLWYDDYGGYVNVLEPTFRLFWRAIFGIGSVNSEHVPLYFLAQFVWSRLVGDSPNMMRGLSIVMGVATIPIVYVAGRQTFGHLAGGIAAFCVALSPIHIFYSQEMRQYALVGLLGAVSLYALLQASREGRAWFWVLHGLANVLLLWTHLFAVFLMVAQGGWLLLNSRRHARRTILWFAFHGLAVAPSLLWIMTRVSMADTSYEHYRVPTLVSVLFDIVGDDAVNVNGVLSPEPGVLNSFPLDSALGYLLAGGFALCLAWALIRSTSCRFDGASGGSEVLFLALVSAVPVLVLATLSYAWRPCIFPRYTLYSSLALYLLAGGAIATLPRRWHRGTAGFVLLGLLAYQLGHTVPYATRTQWREAVALIRSEETPGDVMLVGWPGGATETAVGIFRIHYTSDSNPLLPAFSPEEACEAAECILVSRRLAGQVWTVFQLDYGRASFAEFESNLAERSLAFERTDFDAMEHLVVYRVWADNGGDTLSPADCHTVFSMLVTDALERRDLSAFEVFGEAASACEPEDGPVRAIMAALETSDEDRLRILSAFAHTREGHQYLSRGNLEGAAPAFREARQATPELDLVREELVSVTLKLGLAGAEAGDGASSLAYLAESGALEPAVKWVCRNIVANIEAGRPVRDETAAVRLLLQAFSFSGQPEQQIALARRAIERDPSFAAGFGLMGEAWLTLGRPEDALDALDRHNELCPDYGPAWCNTGRALIALGRSAEAGRAFARCFELDPAAQMLAELVDAIVSDANAEKARAAASRLEERGEAICPELREAVNRLESESSQP